MSSQWKPWAEADTKISKDSPPTRYNTEKFGPGPKASKVWKKFLWSSKAYGEAFLSLRPWGQHWMLGR
jgi:hypothetical protein